MRKFAAMLISLAAAGCATNDAPKLAQSTDPYTNKQQYAFGPIEADTCPGGQALNGDAWISFVGADDLHTMSVDYRGYGWLFLSTSNPLDILVDGQAKQLNPIPAPSREVVRGRLVKESVYYHVTKDFVQSLATANQVRFRVLGTRGSLERCLEAAQLQAISAVVPLVP